MKHRGRKSGAELGTLTQIAIRRPAPPGDLTEFEASLWRTITESKPSDWFRPDSHELLSAYCRHASTHRLLDGQVEAFKPEWLTTADGLTAFGKILQLRNAEVRIMLALSTAMRITQQSVMRADSATARAGTASTAQPWIRQ